LWRTFDDATVVVRHAAGTPISRHQDAAMPQPTQAERLQHPERKMADQEFQFSQFRDEVRVELSALRAETRQLATRNEMQQLITETRSEMQQLIAETRDEMRQLIVETNDETRHLMRVLHEDVISRFAVLEERWNSRPRPAASRRGLHKKR
jgi:hypothetical protein